MSRQVGDWIAIRCGDRVCDSADPRHVGVVEAVRWGSTVVVRFEDTGYLGEIEITSLELVSHRKVSPP